MKITNFRDQVRLGENVSDWYFVATVDVTTGWLWWKKTRIEKITKQYCGYWYFVSTGDYTPDYVVEALCRSYEAKLRGV